MDKLTGFKEVAVIKEKSGMTYHYALYEDGNDYHPGDRVMLSNGNGIKPIHEIISREEAKKRFNGNIIAEVICKVEDNAYHQRVKEREERKKVVEKYEAFLELLPKKENHFGSDERPGFWTDGISVFCYSEKEAGTLKNMLMSLCEGKAEFVVGDIIGGKTFICMKEEE